MAGAITAEQRALLQESLELERARLERSLAGLEKSLQDIVDAAAASNLDDEHDPEGATVGFERAQVASLIGTTKSRLEDVERALERLADGTLDACESCGGDIGFERLQARPGSTRCFTCATRS